MWFEISSAYFFFAIHIRSRLCNIIKKEKFANLYLFVKRSIGVCCPEEVSRNRAASALNIYPQQADDAERALLELGQGRDASGRSIINRGEERGCGLPTKEFAKIVGGRPSDPGSFGILLILFPSFEIK